MTKSSNLWRLALIMLACIAMTACGGDSSGSGSGNALVLAEPSPVTTSTDPIILDERETGESAVEVAKIDANPLVEVPAEAHRRAFTEAGIHIASPLCFDEDTAPPSKDISSFVQSNRVLYTYLIRERDLAAAQSLGFMTNYTAAAFKTQPRPCFTELEQVPVSKAETSGTNVPVS